jgi:aminotransferase
LPETVVQAATDAARSPRRAPAQGLPELRQAIAERLECEIGSRVDIDRVIVTTGAMDALNYALTLLLDPGDEVLVFSPCYFFDGVVRLAGGTIRYVPLQESENYAYRVQALEAAVSPRTRAILITNPNNPTGHVATGEELHAVADVAIRHSLTIVSDESFETLVYDGREHRCILGVPGLEERAILVRSFSKSYCLAGLRVGYLVAPRPMVPHCVKLLEWRTLFNPYGGQKMAAAALRAPPEWREGLALEFQGCRDTMMEGIRSATPFSAIVPQGAPFVFLNLGSPTVDCTRASDVLLRQFGVPCTAGRLHQEPGHVRIAFGGSTATIGEAVRRIGRAAGAIGCAPA